MFKGINKLALAYLKIFYKNFLLIYLCVLSIWLAFIIRPYILVIK